MRDSRATPDTAVATDAAVTTVEVVIIGAGQAGLSTAYHLARLGLVPQRDFVIIDRGPSTGGAWQHRWSALLIGDTHRIHDLPGMSATGLSFEHAPQTEPARDVVQRYYRDYEDHFGFEVVRPATVVSVRADSASQFEVTAKGADGIRRYRAKVVVNASGTWHRPRLPRVAGREVFEGRQLTTTDYVSAHEFAGQRVGVVGAGTSALGFLDELTRAEATTEWFTRREPAFLDSRPHLSSAVGIAAVERQDQAARAGRALPSIVSSTGLPRTDRVRRLEESGVLTRRPMFARMVTDGVLTTDGQHVPLDAVLWATGFDAELDHLDQLALDRSNGGVAVRDGESADLPGLFLAGYGPQASTIGANRAGRSMAREIVARLGR